MNETTDCQKIFDSSWNSRYYSRFGSELSVHNKIMTQSICVDVVVSQLRLMCKVQTGVGSIIYKFTR